MTTANTDPSHPDFLRRLLPAVAALARKAGAAILAIYNQPACQVAYKDDASPLTEADLASHRILVRGLSTLAPQWPILSEESGLTPYPERAAWQYFWLIDPMDGTREFLSRNGEFTVNIALMHRGTPILGVVYAPAIDKLYLAARGLGAFRTHGDTHVPIHARSAARDSLRIVASRSHGSGDRSLEPFTAGSANCEIVLMGSSLKFCLIAEGSADIYPRTGPTMEWDTAAAQCIVHEAGGTVTDLQGNSLLYNKPALVNPSFVTRGKP